MGSLRAHITRFYCDAAKDIALDCEVPALQVRSFWILFVAACARDTLDGREVGRKRIRKGQCVDVARLPVECLRDREGEAAREIGAHRVKPRSRIEDAVSASDYGPVIFERPPGES